MYSNFMFLDRLLFELSCKKTHTHTHTDCDEYSIVAFCKNTTIIFTSIANSIMYIDHVLQKLLSELAISHKL